MRRPRRGFADVLFDEFLLILVSPAGEVPKSAAQVTVSIETLATRTASLGSVTQETLSIQAIASRTASIQAIAQAAVSVEALPQRTISLGEVC